MIRINKVLLTLIVCFSFIIPAVVDAGSVRYPNTVDKDFMADAPWRVKDTETTIPVGFFIGNSDENDLEHLNAAEVVLFRDGEEETIYFHDFGGEKIEQAWWEHTATKFEGAEKENLDGHPITAGNMGFKTGDVIELEARIKAKDDIWDGGDYEFKRRLRVIVGKPFPRPDADWLYGDAHYHTQFTHNPYEYGGGLNTVKLALEAIDLDWVTTTDHASDRSDWDLNEASWNELKEWIADNNGLEGLPFIIGEEITCQPVAGEPENGIHLLVYNNDAFISGKVDIQNDAQLDLNSRLSKLNDSGLAFAAHPQENTDIILKWTDAIGLGDIVPWSDPNYKTALSHNNFYGLEIWNTRTTMGTPGNDLDSINPFTSGAGGWEEEYEENDREHHFLENLNRSLQEWVKLLSNHLNPIRKILINAGSDAHGDLNYFTNRKGVADVACNDNAMGKARTLVYAPGRSDASVLEGVRQGNAIITDGPVLLIGIDKNGDNKLNKGDDDHIVGDIVNLDDENGDVDILINWIAYDGKEIRDVKLFLNKDQIDGRGFDPKTDGEIVGDALEGYKICRLPALMEGNYYLRAECTTEIFHNSSGFEDRYRAYTNPLWLSVKDPLTAAIAAGQRYLIANQVEAQYDDAGNLTDGGYWYDNKQGEPLSSTAFAVAALLETGIPYTEKAVTDGIRYIRKHVRGDGGIHNNDGRSNYTNGACLIALSLYGKFLSEDGNDDSEYRTLVQNAADYAISKQSVTVNNEKVSPDNPYYGGWTYRQNSSGRWVDGDLSNTQYAVMGLWYAYDYLGKSTSGESWADALFVYLSRSHGWYDKENGQTWNDQGWAKGKDTLGVDGAFSYKPDYEEFYPGGSMTGAGIWCLAMIGQDQHPMVDIAIEWFDSNYSWDRNTGSYYSEWTDQDAYYYYVYTMAKALTASRGSQSKVGEHDWVQDVTDVMLDKKKDIADTYPPQTYWEGTGRLDGGNIIATSWVLMSLAFSAPDVESHQKLLAQPITLDNPVKGLVTIAAAGGIAVSNALRTPIADAEKDDKIHLPIGALEFTLSDVGLGETAVLTIKLPAESLIPGGPESFVRENGAVRDTLSWFKILSGEWTPMPDVFIEIDLDASVIRVTLKDGGTEDADGLENGEIQDPGAPGFIFLKEYHTGDYKPADHEITLSEFLRITQLYYYGSYHCDPDSEDGYAAKDGDQSCDPHDSDYNPQDWHISLDEILRFLQLYKSDGYDVSSDGEDGFVPGKP